MINLMEYDQVKNTGKSVRWQFGLVDRCTPEAVRLAAQDKLIVQDAVTGVRFLTTLDQVAKVPYGRVYDSNAGCFDDELSQFVQKSFVESQRVDAALRQFGVNAMVMYPMGDGQAFYVVTRCTKRFVWLSWRGFTPDRWEHPLVACGCRSLRGPVEETWNNQNYARDAFRTKLDRQSA